MKNIPTFEQFIFEDYLKENKDFVAKHGKTNIKTTIREFLNENKSISVENAIGEIKTYSTGSYRNKGLFFGDYGMAEIYELDGNLKIGSLISFKKGGGKWIIQKIMSICDKHSVTIKLLAQAYDKNSDYAYKELNIKDERAILSQKELVLMYKSIGFIISNRNKNSAEMIRIPKK
jgi:hypothetical protein